MAITAVLLTAFTPTPQLLQEPPEKLAKALLPLVTCVAVVPLIKSTVFEFSVQTTSPVTEFAAQELTLPGVETTKAGSPPGLGSIGTRATPVWDENQEPPLGTYAFTLGPPALTARELVGTQAAKVGLEAPTLIFEQLEASRLLNDVAPAVPVTHTK
jgi:hypothetical protein